MARPLPLELPVLQNWSCHTCGGCCKQHGIYVTAEEQRRIETQNWGPADGIPSDQPLFVSMPGPQGTTWQRLAHKGDGRCVFLDEKGLCKIHGRFGEPAKPLACRIYPYAFHPTAKGLTVSLRFSCPSVAENKGTPVVDQERDLQQLAQLILPQGLPESPPPLLWDRTRVSWDDFLHIVDALDSTLAQEEVPFTVKLLQALLWLQLLKQAKLEQVQGRRMVELLQLLLNEAAMQIPVLPETKRPSRLAAVQFRLLAGQYARKDTYMSATPTWRDRWRMLGWGWKFAWGGGSVPAVQSVFQPVPFANLEKPFGPLPEAADELFTRYFRVKVQGLHFCGPAYYQEDAFHGFCSLALIYPVILWIARWLAASRQQAQIHRADLLEALTIADHHHGYSPALGTWGFRSRVRTLVQLQQLGPLISWYSR